MTTDRGSFDPHARCWCPECEAKHSDQAPTADELEIDRLRADVVALRKERETLRADLSIAESFKAGVFHRITTERFDALARAESAENSLRGHRFRRCDIAACNCGLWHAPPSDRLALVEAEREECALVAEGADMTHGIVSEDCEAIAAAIRARSK